jgi:hypothetical protein
MEQQDVILIELYASDQSQLGSLQSLLSSAVPDAAISRVAGQPAVGEQGSLDILAVLASSSGLVTAVRILPEFLKSRRTALSITTTVKGRPFILKATNIDEVMPVLEKLLDD